ncbi:ribulokinase [Streptomyces sp. NBC_00103]|uniref:ribulokinase n=1 Tax=Streptomyces sp. NBC_00103 TaxID=2975653 RepID=UPI00225A0BF8|nr:ribulokinase [Streptomyces sp. NBC_00103]MCX5373550.1 ribulokinase [Streptomyces sp. NBC_00103]
MNTERDDRAHLESCVVGVDFGTLSGRAVVVRVRDGAELGTAEHPYAHAVLDRRLPDGTTLPPDWALQVPSDYIDVLRHAVPQALSRAGVRPEQVTAVGTDFTACTFLPVLADATPLCELPDLVSRPHAYPKLWRHHAAQSHADRINTLAAERKEKWPARYGGKISSEWEFAKALQVLEEDPEVYRRTERWVEAADWIVWRLCGTYVRNACSAGYKGQFQDGSYPSRDYLAALNPDFAGFVTDKLDQPIGELGSPAGTLTAEAAAWTGLPEGITVCVGHVDAHVTAPAAGAVDPGQMVVIMGTSTCHVMSSDRQATVPGMCGIVDGGILPGLWGYEAGQSGVGDIFAWFVRSGLPVSYAEEAAALGRDPHEHLTALAAVQQVGEHGLVALDWHSGNRSVLVDHDLSGVLVGLTLSTRPEDIYRALLEATAFGTRTIIEAFEASDVPVAELVVAGGLTKNALLMQIYADVTRRPLGVIGAAQGPALGAAMHAAVAAGAYPDIRAAAHAMGTVHREAYLPDPERAAAYDRLYAEYRLLHDYFGRGANEVMHRLRRLRAEASAGALHTRPSRKGTPS